MAKGLFDIELRDAEPMPDSSNALLRAEKKRQQAEQTRAEAKRLKENISMQMKQGAAPQVILYTALELIGILTHDADFTAAAKKKLDAVYQDPAQLALFQNELERKRLIQMQTEYNAKLRRSIKRQQAGYKRINTALDDLLRLVDAVEPPPDDSMTPAAPGPENGA